MFIALFALWMIFNGSVTTSSLLLGILISGLITLFCRFFMGYSSKAFFNSLKKAGSMLHYISVLFVEIIKANIAVIKIIWGKASVKPNLVRFKSNLKSDALKVLVANSITLTPGTYTVALEDDCYEVYALDASFNEGIEENIFFKMAEKMEG